MAVTQDKPGPYAPASAILEIIHTHRRKGLPSPLTADVLQRVGIADSLIPRTLQALQALDLVDDQAKATRTLEGLRLAPEGEFKDRLSEWLKIAYADVLTYVDPASDDETRIRDAFRTYNPVGQQPRMVSLFLGLAAAAGMVGEKKSTPSQKRHRPTFSGPLRKPSREPDGLKGGKIFSGGGAHSGGGAGIGHPKLPPPLAGLLSSLPSEGGSWSQVRRDKFVETFGAVIDFCFRIEEDASSPEANNDHAREEEDA
jgi:hypothetical protein